MDQFGFEGKRKMFSFWENEIIYFKEPTKLPQKSNIVNANAL